ncbi:MAG: hypothetical protein DWB56_06805 [Candidatus Jettenia sp.]|nr:hypothetical protein [Candidatus Jettenia sp.]MDL1938494.1 hypothetical protein [Candidatus Jettenia sp. AMX1]
MGKGFFLQGGGGGNIFLTEFEMCEIKSYLEGFERHLRILQALSEGSVRTYRDKILEFFTWLEEMRSRESEVRSQKGIADITRQDVERYLEHCFYKGNGNQTRFTKLIALQKFFRYLVYEGVIKEDSTANIPRPKIWKKFVQKFTQQEVLEFFRVINIMSEKGLRDAVIVILAAFAGLRVSEILNLDLTDVIDDGKAIDITIRESKHHSSRVVYLWKVPSLFVRKWLSIRLSHHARGEDPFIISYRKGGKVYGDGKRLTANAVDAIIKRYAERAGIRKAKIHIHMFRATHASDLRSIQGYDIAAIGERLGHKHAETTMRYFPTRGRIHRIYPSLAAYWQPFTNLWIKKDEGEKIEGSKQ